MSYILDALNKADKERKQSETPASKTIIAVEPTAQPNTAWLMALLVIGLLIILWFVFQPKETVKTVAPTVATIAPMQTRLKPKPKPTKRESTVQITSTFTSIKPQEIQEEPRAIPNIMGLDQDIRNRLPAISISAHVFSDNAAKCMVIINNQVLREGDYIGEGLRLTDINQDGIQLNFEGEPFTMKTKGKWPLY